MIPHRFKLDDVDGMSVWRSAPPTPGSTSTSRRARSSRATRECARQDRRHRVRVRPGRRLRPRQRQGGSSRPRPSLTVETSPGNFHYWYLFDQPVAADEAKRVGDLIRVTPEPTRTPASSRSAIGCPARPITRRKRNRRAAARPWSRHASSNGRIFLWELGELERRSPAPRATAQASSTGRPLTADADEASLPDELIRTSATAASPEGTERRATNRARGFFIMSSGN